MIPHRAATVRERTQARARDFVHFLTAVALCWSSLAFARAAEIPRPKLILLLVAEQFRPDYLDRYRASFSPGGFNRLLKGGAVFRQCQYQHLATFPAPGAAVIATGAYPELTGIVADRWYDRRSGRVVSAVEDSASTLVGSGQPGASPRKLLATTLADQLRLVSSGRARTLSLSLRDQTAVLLGGLKPTGCYWLDETGHFVTSSYYRASLSPWVAEFEKSHPTTRFRNRPWKAIDAKNGAPPLRLIDTKEGYLASPFALDEEFDLAREAVIAEQLGHGPATDLLVVSLSPFYLLGIETGADSPLMRDLVLRLDRRLEDFLSWLDARLGADHVWTVFTATQGMAELPEMLESRGIPAGRVAGDKIVAAIEARLTAAFGPDRYVERYVFPSLYLRKQVLDKLPDAPRLAGEAALTVPGVAGYFVPSGAASFQSPETTRPIARSWAPQRAGDVLLAYQPYHSELFGDGRGVSPGSFYTYDTRVPLIFWGAAFRGHVSDRAVSPADLAATLAAALDIPPPASSTGRVLAEALKER